MKKIFKSISMLLTVVMLLGSFAVLFTVNTFAADTAVAAAETEDAAEETVVYDVDHINDYFATPEEKLKTMTLIVEKSGARLYVDKVSGEVAYVNTLTGEKLFTNPYDVATSTGNDATKSEILSQIIVKFTDSEGQEKTFTSFAEASMRNQIVVENIKNGVRVEYTIGRDQSKILVPRLISMDRFEEMIIAPLYEVFGEELYNPRSSNREVFDVQKMMSYFMVYAVDKLELSDRDRVNIENTYGGLYDDLQSSDAQYARAVKQYPIIDTMPVIVFDPDASETELTQAEEIITKYCPSYTYEELTYDHILTEYKSDDANPPVFRMALEYRIEADGLSVRLPANGIRFNESLYTPENIQVLPYMGAGNSAYEGYNFFPDGAGTLFDFQDLNTNQTRAVSGKVYGTDFAYHEVTGTYQKTIRYPVFGIVEDTTYYTYTQYNDDGDQVLSEWTFPGNIVDAVKAYNEGGSVNFCKGQESKLDSYLLVVTGTDENNQDVGLGYYDIISRDNTVETKTVEKRGFVCIIEEGDALASLTTYHAGALSDYNTIKMEFTPRPKDSYNLADSISVGSNDEWTVVSDRKYVGNYAMKYITLSETEPDSDEDKTNGKYDASWLGMAVAYRDYLTDRGVISKISDAEITKDNIPLYIETFGTIETTKRIMSIPVDVMTPLTTFENVKTMYDELSAQGMKNINFKLTGYANGGMAYTMPGKLKFEKAVGGNDGFKALLEEAENINENADQNLGIYPDFDFAYTSNSAWFDGHSARKHNAQTIDGRYSSKRVYSATQQKYINYFEMLISPAYFAEFYNMLEENYANKFGTTELNISVSTLGNALNSDFDEDEPYNREDSKEFTAEAFEHFDQTYTHVMTDGGNAYVWKYADHILDVSLESSRYNFSSEAVPFIGVVLHGSVRFAGEPLNMEGDLEYALLKAIENGASPYFILSYQNTQVLKSNVVLSQYYSIRYDIWSDDIVDSYNTLNGALADVQNKYIVGHQFINDGTRVPDADELLTDVLAAYEAELDAERNAAEYLAKQLAQAANIARENGREAEKFAAQAVIEALDIYAAQLPRINNAVVHSTEYYTNVKTAYAEYRKVSALKDSDDSAEKALYEKIDTIYNIVLDYDGSFSDYSEKYDALMKKYNALLTEADFESKYKEVAALYTKYAKGEILSVDAEIALLATEAVLDKAVADYKAGNIDEAKLLEAINKYGVTKIDTSSVDKDIASYIAGTLADDVLNSAEKEELKAVVSEYLAGTLAYNTLIGRINAWADALESIDEAALKTELAKYKASETELGAVEAAIAKYSSSKINKAELIAAVDAYAAAASDLDKKENSYKAYPVDEAVYNAAKAEYDKAVATFNDAVATYVDESGSKRNFTRALNTFLTAYEKFEGISERYDLLEGTREELKAAYEAAKAVCENAYSAIAGYSVASIDAAEAKAASDAYLADVDKYIVNTAAAKAYTYVLDVGFNVTFEEAYDVYYDQIKTELYKGLKDIVNKEWPVEGDLAAYRAYYLASSAADDLNAMKRSVSKPNTNYNKYVVALAQYDHMVESGVAGDELAEAEASKNLLRAQAITTVARTDMTYPDRMDALYAEAQVYLDLAIDAIEVLAGSEGANIEYVDEDRSNPTKIINVDKLPFIVREAVEKAVNVYNTIGSDSFDEVIDGALTGDKFTDTEGVAHDIYRTTTATGKTIYFYGEYENGYQYLVKSADAYVAYNASDSDSNNAGWRADNSQAVTMNGEVIYKDNELGGVYVVYGNEGQIFYTRTSDGSYVPCEAISYTYDEGASVGETANGEKVYLDGETYFSVNADGTYTRYTYNKSVKSCADEIKETLANTMNDVAAVAEKSSDDALFTDIEERIALYKMMNSTVEEEEEIEEVTDFKYSTENIVAVTYGNDDGTAYKTIILNYNNYAVRVEYKGNIYTIAAHKFVEVKE